jgi:hypothetical protein
MTTYRAIERGSWEVRAKAKGKHGGALGRSALRVLETFLDGWLISNLVTIPDRSWPGRLSRRRKATAQ